MKNLITFGFLALISISAFAGSGTIVLNGKITRNNATFVQLKNGTTGEFSEIAHEVFGELKFKGNGDLSGTDEFHEVKDDKVYGVDMKGRSEGRLVKDSYGKIFWKTEMEYPENGKNTKVNGEFEVEFTKGDWDALDKGDAVELRMTKKARQDFVDQAHALFIALAEGLRAQYIDSFPSATIDPVQVDKKGASGDGTLKGDSKKLELQLPTVFLDASVKAIW